MTQTNTTQNKEELEQWEKDFDALWRRIANTIKTNYESRKIWIPDLEDEEGDYLYVDETLKKFITKLLSQAHQSGIEEERKRIRKK